MGHGKRGGEAAVGVKLGEEGRQRRTPEREGGREATQGPGEEQKHCC